ncbi:outer membrane beta-barrel protein [Arachidicoccus sp.]|uniref:outer membrane beta-barrel protein n=1 Tax=Arachidicoccus sp. TaxID=1872624 RepID=UPI003D1AAC3E
MKKIIALMLTVSFVGCLSAQKTTTISTTYIDSSGKTVTKTVTTVAMKDSLHRANADESNRHHKKSIEFGFKNKDKSAYFGINPGFGFGWNRFIDNGSIGVTKNNSNLTLDKGPEFIFTVLKGYVDIAPHHSLRISTSLGFDWNTYHFERNITLKKGQDSLSYTIDDSRHFTKNLLRSTYLFMPLTLNIRPVKKSDFTIAAGVEGGVLLGAKTKQKSEEDGKVKVHGTFNLNPVRYGLFLGLEYQEIGLYAKYYLSDVFANGEGPKDFKTVSIGLSVGLF